MNADRHTLSRVLANPAVSRFSSTDGLPDEVRWRIVSGNLHYVMKKWARGIPFRLLDNCQEYLAYIFPI